MTRDCEETANPRPWDTVSSKRASALFTVLKWFKPGGSDTEPDSDASSCGSAAASCCSDDTVASFSYVAGGERGGGDKSDGGGGLSLPLMRGGDRGTHRRTASDSDRYSDRRRVKRRAPQPPSTAATKPAEEQAAQSNTQQRRKKRMAPQPPVPPDVISNDSLRLEHGVLRPARLAAPQVQEPTVSHSEMNGISAGLAAVVRPMLQQLAPRPWYKRSAPVKDKPTGDQDKRRSCNMSFLTNISELDRQATEILERQTLRMQYLKTGRQVSVESAPGDMAAIAPADPGRSPKRRTARDLIAKFNAITGAARQSRIGLSSPVGSPLARRNNAAVSNVPPNSPLARLRQQPIDSKPQSQPTVENDVNSRLGRAPWRCPRCSLQNEYWRIICRVCSAIKPYFDISTGKITESGNETEPVRQYNGSSVTGTELDMFGKQLLCKERPTPTTTIPVQQPQTSTSNLLDQILQDIERNARSKNENGSTLFPHMENKDETKMEKIILGDEINVEKPRNAIYTNTTDTKQDNTTIVENMSFGNGINVTKHNSEQKVDEVTKRETCKNEEREALKKMLIEMKNSLSKRSPMRSREVSTEAKRVSVVREEESREEEPKEVHLIAVTTETTYENIKVRNGANPSAIKVNSGCQTKAVVRVKTVDAGGDYQLIGANEFAGMRAYANVASREKPTVAVIPRSDDLLRQLEAAIAGGEREKAAELAGELAKLRLPCSLNPQPQPRPSTSASTLSSNNETIR